LTNSNHSASYISFTSLTPTVNHAFETLTPRSQQHHTAAHVELLHFNIAIDCFALSKFSIKFSKNKFSHHIAIAEFWKFCCCKMLLWQSLGTWNRLKR